MYLSHLKCQDTAYIAPVTTPDPLLMRLIDMGLNYQAPITCLFENLSGTMRAYSFLGNTFALRSSDACNIEVLIK